MFLVVVVELPIFAPLNVLTANNQKDGKPSNPPTPQRKSAAKQEIKCPPPQPAVVPSPIVLPLNIPGKTKSIVPTSLTTVTPQPVIVNNQVFLHLSVSKYQKTK